jgi:hypothetical protein
MLRPGSAGSNTAADHLRLLREAIDALPPALRRRLMVTCDRAGVSHELVKELVTFLGANDSSHRIRNKIVIWQPVALYT